LKQGYASKVEESVNFPLTFTPQGDWNLLMPWSSQVMASLSTNLYPARGLKPTKKCGVCRNYGFPLTFTPQGDWNNRSTNSDFPVCSLSTNLYPARGLKLDSKYCRNVINLLSTNLYPARGLKLGLAEKVKYDLIIFPLTFTPQGDWNSSILPDPNSADTLSTNLYPARGLKLSAKYSKPQRACTFH